MTRLLFVLGLLAAASLGGTPALAKEPAGNPGADTTLPGVDLNVAHVDVIPAYVPPRRKPNVDHLLAMPPVEAIRLWATLKVKAVGNRSRAAVIIRRASIVRVPIPGKKGIKYWFKRQPLERLDGAFEVELVIKAGNGTQLAKFQTRVAHAKIVMDDFKPADRRRLRQELTREAVRAMAETFTKEVRKALPQYVR